MTPFIIEYRLAGGVFQGDGHVQIQEGADLLDWPDPGGGDDLHALGEAMSGMKADMVQQVCLGGNMRIQAGGFRPTAAANSLMLVAEYPFSWNSRAAAA